MAKLSKKKREKLPASDFAGPGRSYPIPDKKHAVVALGLAKMHGAPPETVAKIKRKAKSKGVKAK